MINLERSFKKILKEWGHDVYIQRIMPNNNYRDTIERVTTRNVFSSGITNAKSAQEQIEGIAVNSEVVYYFEAEINPQEGDRIYESLPNAFSKQTIYLIDTCSPRRGKNGKIIFWVVGATKEKQV
jgi:hypothetical protein